MINSILLVLALAMDSFTVSIAYGMRRVKIPIVCALTISVIGTTFLSASLFLTVLISKYINQKLFMFIGGSILIIIGVYNLIKYFKNKNKANNFEAKFLNFKNSVLIGVSLSLDSLISGFAGGFGINIYLTIIFSFFTNLFVVLFGNFLGKKFSNKVHIKLDWLTGVIFIALGIFKIL